VLGTNGSFGGMADGNSMYRDAFRDGAASYAGHPVPPFQEAITDLNSH
jgi:hypothetical protein